MNPHHLFSETPQLSPPLPPAATLHHLSPIYTSPPSLCVRSYHTVAGQVSRLNRISILLCFIRPGQTLPLMRSGRINESWTARVFPKQSCASIPRRPGCWTLSMPPSKIWLHITYVTIEHCVGNHTHIHTTLGLHALGKK